MHKIFIKNPLYISFIAGLISLQGCKLDAPIYPDNSGSHNSPTVDDVKKPHLFVSTYVQGINTLPHPSRICTTADGTMYITSAIEGKVFKVTTTGIVTTVLKNVKNPVGIKSDSKGNVYVMLTRENKIAKIAPGGTITTVKINADINSAQDLAIAGDGTLYIADTGNSRILQVNTDGIVTTLAGKIATFGLKDGIGQDAHFSTPTNIRLASDGFLWVIDGDGAKATGQTIRRVTKKGQVNTYFTQQNKALTIMDMALAKIDKDLNPSSAVNVFLVFSNNTIIHFATNGVQTTLAKITTAGFTDGDIKTAQFSNPAGISVNDSCLFITDQDNNALRKIAAVKPN
ncbi:hypothetical protein IDJ77_04495 [Mucilaginibacter sp. ZT4R22]|uniref:Sugar lactone lactonase YvrE n=1 Tax=Mucilaginibacter pankratovii TaxID=2772110 RepID=A0ABR7WP40_9SPHI|nr:hypothetical protein [Mucilaginibacter pankratovii]MBD1363062.1 hypothetical protein [Mucilaginibacter pankratovii]